MSVTLHSNDNEQFTVTLQVAKMSGLIRDMLHDLGGDEGDDVMPIPLPNVDAPTLQTVLAFCEHHKDDAVAAAENSADDLAGTAATNPVLDEWDQAFFAKMPNEQRFALLSAANYLDVRLLLDYGCKTVADSIKGKTVAEIRTIFDIQNDFTPEEEEAIRKENEWCADAEI